MTIFNPNIKKHNFKDHPMYIAKQIHVDNQLGGTVMVYQRAEVIPGGDCETIGDWAETDSGEFDVTATGSGKVGSNSITLTQTDADGLGSIYLLLSASVDYRWANYIGYWYQGGDGDIFTAGDIELYLFTDPTDYEYADAQRKINLFVGDFTEEGTAVWHYNEILISDMTLNTGYEGVSLKEVWGLGFYSGAGVDGNVLIVDHIELYTLGTDYGPARGQIKAAVIADGVTVAQSDGLAWTNAGRVKISADNDPEFAGIAIAAGSAVGAEKGKGVAYFVVDGPVNMLCNDGSIADNEGVACSAVGGSLTIDDGGGTSLPFNIGKATEAGLAAQVITVMLGDARGSTA